MIRINLVAERKAEKARKPLITIGSGNEAMANAMLGGVIAASLLFGGYKYMSLTSQIRSLDGKIADGNRERERLKEILARGEEFKAQRELLKRKVDLITQLKKNQSVPVYLLDQLSRNLPDYLWLAQVTERTNQISITGHATTFNAVSNFYNNLSDSPFFGDVVLGTTQSESQGVSFSISCRFVPEAGHQAEETGAPGEPPADAPAPAAGA
jgi:Tfp pilus assembly protein PilN